MKIYQFRPKKIINNRETRAITPDRSTSKPLEYEPKAQTYIFVLSTLFCVRITWRIPNHSPSSFAMLLTPRLNPPPSSPLGNHFTHLATTVPTKIFNSRPNQKGCPPTQPPTPSTNMLVAPSNSNPAWVNSMKIYQIWPKKWINNRECQPTDPDRPISKLLECEPKAQTYIFVFSTLFCVRITFYIPNPIPTPVGWYLTLPSNPLFFLPSQFLPNCHAKLF